MSRRRPPSQRFDPDHWDAHVRQMAIALDDPTGHCARCHLLFRLTSTTTLVPHHITALGPDCPGGEQLPVELATVLDVRLHPLGQWLLTGDHTTAILNRHRETSR